MLVSVASPEIATERNGDLAYFIRGLGQAAAAEQHIGLYVVAAEEVADATAAHMGGSRSPEPLAPGVAVAGVRLHLHRPALIEAHHDARRRPRT